MNIDSLIVAASFSPKSLQFPNAWVGHLPFAAWLIKEISPRIFVELGTHSGNSYFSFCQAVEESLLPTKCYAVDTWQGDEHAGQYGDEIFVQVNTYHQAHYAEFSRLLRMTFDDATEYFADGSIDLLHIDGRHTYEAVKHDFETWLPKLAPGAVVLFHDTNVRERGFGVWQLWEELQVQYRLNLEFLHSHGLGVLQLAHGPVEKQLSWLAPGAPAQQILKNYFSALGSRQTERYELNDQRKALVDREGQIAALNQAVVERDDQIARRDEQIDAYMVQAEQFDVQLRGAFAQIQTLAERDGQIASLTQALAQCENELAALRGSLSMRITAPLRLLSRPVRGSWKEIRRIKEGGLRKLSLRARRIFQEFTHDQEKLPKDFDPEIYLKLNPDVAAAGNDPATHYSLYGVHEGRSYLLPAMNLQGEHNLTDTRETILVVSHEASRTGAPVLSLNLVQSLVGRYNVVVLLLGGGALTEAFHQAGAAVMTSSNLRGNPLMAGIVVNMLCKRFSFKFALVNSIESREVLPALYDHAVPSVTLVHEFASYTRPRDAFRSTLLWSGEVVFSAKITLDNAMAEYPDLRARVAHVLPQGRSFLPSEGLSKQQLEEESARIRCLIRPHDIAEDTLVILGAGSVHLRKGVDLFIECAARVVQAPEGRKCRFIWVGNGYDPDNDAGYSVYLTDQITRSGLHGHVFFIDETTAIETAYEEADLFLLSSRLDPLPNVAIDAMSHGVPVLCFDKTTGIADFLVDSGLRSHCVAAYLDTAEMAEKILAFVNSQTQYVDVATRCREASIAYFNMGKYVARLEDMARDLGCRMQQEQVDIELILQSGLFRPDFAIPPDKQHHSLEEQVRFYVRAWASGLSLRKPFPGYHPGIYLEQHGVADQGADPFADYLRQERPEGPWSCPVIVAGKIAQKDLPASKRVALHIHAYYPELLPEIITRLSGNLTCPDLFVSVTDTQARDQVNSLLKNYKGTVVDVRLVPNRGRDIGPLLTAFGQQILANYDYVGHIHTKKTADLKDSTVGQVWYQFLLENLLGGVSGALADCILARLKEDVSIGMAYPDDPYIVGWSANRALAESLAARIGLEKLPEQFDFPVGTMFWSRTTALAPLVNINLDWDDYSEEPLPYDGTMLHAIERLLPLTLPLSNLRRATTNVFGLTR